MFSFLSTLFFRPGLGGRFKSNLGGGAGRCSRAATRMARCLAKALGRQRAQPARMPFLAAADAASASVA